MEAKGILEGASTTLAAAVPDRGLHLQKLSAREPHKHHSPTVAVKQHSTDTRSTETEKATDATQHARTGRIGCHRTGGHCKTDRSMDEERERWTNKCEKSPPNNPSF